MKNYDSTSDMDSEKINGSTNSLSTHRVDPSLSVPAAHRQVDRRDSSSSSSSSLSSTENLEDGEMDRDTDELFPSEEKPSLTKCQIIFCFSGCILFLISLGMLAGGSGKAFDALLKKELKVEEGSPSYEIWKSTPFPLRLNLYAWNITNHKEFLKGATPELQECGPYVFMEHHEKKHISFHPNNTVTYFQQRWWIWDEELSGNNSKDDLVYTLNPVPLSAAWAVRENPFYIAFLNMVFNDEKEQLIIKTSVQELFFSGFEDPVLDWVQKNLIAVNGTYHYLLPFLDLPSGIAEYERFGWFYMRNMSVYYDGIFNMKTGADNIHNVGKIDWWNYTRGTDYFDAPCNRVTGSTGEFFEPGLGRDKVIVFSSDLCMSMSLFYKEDVKRNDLKAYRFWGSNHTFANGSTVPGNECYCVKRVCSPMGLLNAESCRFGAPAFISFPHFFNADPFLLEQVNGLKPEEEKHAFMMDIMPEAGIPVNVQARVQINLRVKPYPGEGILHTGKIDILKEVPDVYLPMVWFEELVSAPEDTTKQLWTLQFFMSTPTVTIFFSFLLLLGISMVAYIVYVAYRLKFRPEESYDDRFPEGI